MLTCRNIIICLAILFASYFLASCIPATCTDIDGDTYSAIDAVNCPAGNDCDDSNADVYPGATETPDLVDEDCDGVVDNGFKYVFVTSLATTGNMQQHGSGTALEGADKFCQDHADAGLVPTGIYKAWLSADPNPEEPGPVINARARIPDPGLPYVNVIGETIAVDRDALLYASPTKQLTAAIKYDEVGDFLETAVWTGTYNSGIVATAVGDCNEWRSDSSSDQSLAGKSTWQNSYWTHHNETSCDTEASVYCFQQ